MSKLGLCYTVLGILLLSHITAATSAAAPRGSFRVSPSQVFVVKNALGRNMQCAPFSGTYVAGRLQSRVWFLPDYYSVRVLQDQLQRARRRRNNTRQVALLTARLNALILKVNGDNQRCVRAKQPPPTPTPTPVPPTERPTPVPTSLPPPSGDAVSLLPLDRPVLESDVRLFLERGGFGLSAREQWLVPIATSQGVQAMVTQFLNTRNEDPGVWDHAVDLLDGRLGSQSTTHTPTGQRSALLSLWTHTNNPFPEKLSIFLLSTWTVSGDVIGDETFRFVFWDYYQKLRTASYAGAYVPDLAVQLSRDPLMLIYLNNELNKKLSPNENFARELMELFTLGTDDLDHHPNYTETQLDGSGDIAVAARALTGWKVRPNYAVPELTVSFNSSDHASGPHLMFAGMPYQFSCENDEGLIRGILARHPSAAIYYARELLAFYLTPNPPRELVEQFANVIREENFSLRPALARLFQSKAFYHPLYRDTLPKNAIEFGVEVIKLLRMEDAYNEGETDRLFFRDVMPINLAPSVFWFNSAAWTSPSLALDRVNFLARLYGDLTAQRKPDPDWTPDSILPLGDLSAKDMLVSIANRLGIPRIPDNAELQLESYMNRERQWDGSYLSRPYDNSNADQRRNKGLGAYYVLFATPEFVLK